MQYLEYVITAVPFLILAAAVIAGRVRGFAGIVFSTAAVIVCMILARSYAAPLAEAVTSKIIHERLVGNIAEKLIEGLAGGKQTLGQILPAALGSAAADSGIALDSSFAAQSVNKINEAISLSAESYIIIPLLTAVFFVLVYAAAKALSRVFIRLSDLILKLPFIRQANNWLGAVLGAFTGIILAAISVLILVSLSKLMPDTAFAQAVQKASLINLIYEKIQMII